MLKPGGGDSIRAWVHGLLVCAVWGALSFAGAGSARAADSLTVSPTASIESGQPARSVPATISASVDDPWGSYLELEVLNPSSADLVSLPLASSASTETNVVSIVGSSVFIGDGSYARRIGSVDPLNTSATKARITIDLFSFTPTSVTRDAGFSNWVGWTADNPLSTDVPSSYGDNLSLPGTMHRIGGWPSTWGGGGDDALSAFPNTAGVTLTNQSVVTTNAGSTYGNAMALYLNMTPSGPIPGDGANLRGAAVYSEPFSAQAGDRFSFAHRNNCQDAGDSCASGTIVSTARVNLWVGLLDTSTGALAAVAHGESLANTGWGHNYSIAIPATGTYQFVAIAGGSWPAGATSGLSLKTKVNLTNLRLAPTYGLGPTLNDRAATFPQAWPASLLRQFLYRSTGPASGPQQLLTYRMGQVGGAELASTNVTVSITHPVAAPALSVPPVVTLEAPLADVVPPVVVAPDPVVPPEPAPAADPPASQQAAGPSGADAGGGESASAPPPPPPAPEGPEPFDPLGSPESIAAAAGAAALAAALAGAVAGASAGGGSSSSSDSGGSSDSESVELDALEASHDELEISRKSWGDTWGLLALPALTFLDRASHRAAVAVAPISPMLGKMIVDGAYLRSIIGSVSLLLPLATTALALVASASNDGGFAPPPWEIFLIMAIIGNFDALAGFVGGIVFIGATLVGAEDTATIGDLRMLFVVLFVVMAPGLLMTAFRPLRKDVEKGFAGLWDRATDLAIAPLLAGVAASTAVVLVPALSGVSHPVSDHAAEFGLFIALSAAARVLLEELATRGFPQRLDTINPSRMPEAPGLQQAAAIAFSYAVWVFLTGALVGNVWQIYVGSLLFLFPTILGKFQDRFPNVVWLWHILPQGLPGLVFALTVAIATTSLVMEVLGLNPVFAAWNMVLLPLPLLALAVAGMFGRHGRTPDQTRFSQRHPVVFRLGGVVVFLVALRLMGVL